MEQEYDIGVTNRYALFLEESSHEEDPLDIIKNAEAEKAKKKTKAALGDSKENRTKFDSKDGLLKAVKSGRRDSERNQGGQDRSVKFSSGPGDNNNAKNRDEKSKDFNFRNGDGSRRKPDDNSRPLARDNRRPRREGNKSIRSGDENKPPRHDRREFQERDNSGVENDDKNERRNNSASPRNRNRLPTGGSRGYDNRGKREFERKSGSAKTGVKAVEKRDGAGAHNWGTHKDDLESSQNLESNQLSDEFDLNNSKTDNDHTDKEENNTDVENIAPVDDEPKELTLDEWRALRGKREMPQFNLRKAGEGEDLTQWKDMYEIKKKKETEHQDDEEEYDQAEYSHRTGRQKQILDIDIAFSDSRRGPRGNRAPRPAGLNPAPGSGRQRFRDGPRRTRDDKPEFNRDRDFHPRNRQSAPKFDDEHDFPSLG